MFAMETRGGAPPRSSQNYLNEPLDDVSVTNLVCTKRLDGGFTTKPKFSGKIVAFH